MHGYPASASKLEEGSVIGRDEKGQETETEMEAVGSNFYPDPIPHLSIFSAHSAFDLHQLCTFTSAVLLSALGMALKGRGEILLLRNSEVP